MGGASAAVKVFEADNNLVGYFTNGHFKDSSFPNTEEGSWAVAFFDEVMSLYDEKPNRKDNFDAMYNPAENMEVQIK